MAVNVHPRVEHISKELIEQYRTITPASIGHLIKFGFMDPGIRPVWRRMKLVGPALTVRMVANDNALNRQAIRHARPGDVIVVERVGDKSIACWGEVTSLAAKQLGIAGIIIDGAITDVIEIEDMGWPAFSRSISAVLGRRYGDDGEINTTINCGGVPVNPGDLIVADDNGVCVLTPELAQELVGRAREAEDHSLETVAQVNRGEKIEGLNVFSQ